MRPLQMVDTKSQYLKIKDEVDTAVISVMESSQFIGGKVLADFAANLATYHGCKHVIPCANGTDALQIAMMALNLAPGDEVITPSFTYIATVEVAALLGIKPVFVEVDEKTFCISPEAIEKAISPKTKAIIPVHLYGHAANMEMITPIAKKHGLFIIEDNAQGIGNDYIFSDGSMKKTGTIGDIGCTSFYPSKNLGAYGDGGAMFTNDDRLAEKLRMIASHGQSKRYYHDVVGCNSRLDTIQAAILDIKLKHLDEYIGARRKAADFYDRSFAGMDLVVTPYRADYNNHVFHQYTLLLQKEKNAAAYRDGLHKFLADKGVPSMIYYPVPAHRQKMFDAFGGGDYNLPVTDWLTERVISLPIHTELDEEQQQYIVSSVVEYINQ
ncbi:MAG TPA: DegT/DnrJ/EryC1/StrS family aminotransferase [Ferruginibacter sp.]|nr:DegT/DnrJ/EryC1/StrS family aminotransferase [Ferruginibacter sp.]